MKIAQFALTFAALLSSLHAFAQASTPPWALAVQDQVEQYRIVRAHGTPTEVCAHASVIASLFLTGHDEDGYIQWNAIKKRDCAAAGIPSM